METTADALFRQGFSMLPRWGDDGPDADRRHAAALEVITRAAEAGSVEAMEHLAGAAETPEARFSWAVAAAKPGEYGELATLCTNGDNPPWCGERLLEAARAGEPWAALALAAVYGAGLEDAEGVLVATVDGAWGWLPGVADPEAEARAWRERAAAGGDARAHLALALEGRFDAPDRALASARAAIAAGGLLPKALRRAGTLLVELLDRVEAPLPERIAAREGLAEGGHAESAAWLGDHHRRGEGVPADLARARAWYERAAAAGDVDGLRELGKLCETGKGGPKDLERARALYEQAAELGGDAYARRRLVKKFGLAWYGT